MTETESQPQQTEDGQILLRAKGISKGFPGVWEHLILDKIDLEIRKGEVHTLLGENGAGKTVLANILSGFYTSTGGKVFVEGKEVALHSPQDGLAHGIGMIHQEVMLAKPFTVAENVLLGNDSPPLSYPLKRVEREIEDLSQQFGLAVDPTAKVSELSAGEQQRAEILKVLYYRPQVLLLDEPTSLLTPQESQDLFQVLREMATEGFGILFITHKMEEVMKVSDRVTVLKLGEVMGERNIEETDKDELTQMMLDEKIPIKLERKETVQEEKTLNVNDLSVAGQAGERKVLNLSFEVMQGEILGVAGVSGNGQSELIEALTGLREPESGMVEISGENMTGAGSRAVIEQDVA
ncbi:MAG: ATP-binding cassette domain-containing protein, partial [Candidatus Bipolaricaulota bacterium]